MNNQRDKWGKEYNAWGIVNHGAMYTLAPLEEPGQMRLKPLRNIIHIQLGLPNITGQ